MTTATAKQRTITRFDVVLKDGRVLLECAEKLNATAYHRRWNLTCSRNKDRAKLVRVKWTTVEQ